MNYDALDKLIPTRRLPDDQTSPRKQLFEMFRNLAELQAERPVVAAKLAAAPDSESLRKEQQFIDEHIGYYEQILER